MIDFEAQNSREAIGERIKELRNSRKMSQTELGELLYITRSDVNNKEHGKGGISIEQLMRLSEIFGVSTDYILTGVKPENRTVAKELGLSDEAIDCLKQKCLPNELVDFCIRTSAGQSLLLELMFYLQSDYEHAAFLDENSAECRIVSINVPGTDLKGESTLLIDNRIKPEAILDNIQKGNIVRKIEGLKETYDAVTGKKKKAREKRNAKKK